MLTSRSAKLRTAARRYPSRFPKFERSARSTDCMNVHVTTTSFSCVAVINIDFPRDERGFFVESWHKKDFADAGIEFEFVQDCHSRSRYRVLRGLHYQDMHAPLVKLVRCTVGKILDVAVDLRVSSPTFGKWFSVQLSAENKTQ